MGSRFEINGSLHQIKNTENPEIYDFVVTLQVEPFASLVDSVRHGAPRLLINREKVGPFKSKSRNTDAVAAGEMLEVVERFTALLGWKRFVNETMEEHEKLYEVRSD